MTSIDGVALKGWSVAMGITIVHSSSEEVVGEIDIGEIHQQSFGIVHGGVYCGLIETLGSIGAYLAAKERGHSGVAGLENTTSFVRAVSSGRIRGVAKPIAKGTSTQLWEVVVCDDQGRVVSLGRVRLLCLH